MIYEPIYVGIAGIGRAGWNMHTGALEKRRGRFKIAAACDKKRERREWMKERFACPVYDTVEEMAADPSVELVDIATPSKEHLEHALLALKAGKHLFLEKPMAASYGEAKKIAEAAERSKGDLYVRHNRRFEPAFQHLKELIASGIIGDVFECKLRRGGFSFREDWQTLREMGGGQLLNWGPHLVDQGLRFLESPLSGVWSDLRNVVSFGDAEDHCKIILKGENGRIVDVEVTGATAIPDNQFTVLGSRGALVSDGSVVRMRYIDPDQKIKRRKAKSTSPPVEGGFRGRTQIEWIEKEIPVSPIRAVETESIWDALYDSIRLGKPFPVTTEEALEVMKVITLAKRGTEYAAVSPE